MHAPTSIIKAFYSWPPDAEIGSSGENALEGAEGHSLNPAISKSHYQNLQLFPKPELQS